MSESKPTTDETSGLKTKLALTRISRWHGLATDSISLVRQELMTSLGLEERASSSETTQTLVVPAAQSDNNQMQTVDTSSELNAQMRHLVSAGAPWHVIFSHLWADYQKTPSMAKAARILETAFVEASPSETLQIFAQLMTTGQKGFYWYLHPKLRDFIIEHAPQQYLDQLYWTIAKERDDSKLSGIEMTYIFLRVATTSDKTAAWMYFRRHQERILNSFSRIRHFGMTREQLTLRAGELALGLGFSSDARDLFLKLPNGSDERETALQLILRFESTTVDREKNSYFVQIESTNSWEERLALISSFCEATRKLGGNKDPNRAALDQILKSLLQWVPKSPEAWRSAGELIIRNRDIAGLLPSLFQPLLDQAVIFHGPDFDSALWSAAQNIKPISSKEALLHASALLHRYVTNPRLGEQILWQAYGIFRSLEMSKTSMAWNCRELVKAARQWINDSTILVDRDRKRAAAALRLAHEGSLATQPTVESYLNLCDTLPEALLLEIAKNALASRNSDFALSMLIRLGLRQSFTNQQLLEMWNLAAQSESPDSAWRIATVMASRDALPDYIKSAWDISGENRSVYQAITITPEDVESALSEMSAAGKKLIRALCVVGAKVNELAIISQPSSPTSSTMSGSSSTEGAIVGALKNSAAMPKAPRNVLEMTGIHMIPDAAAPLAQAIITSPWLFSAKLIAERLSISSWGWSIETLQQNAKTVLPLIGRDPTGKSSAKINRWLSSLTSSERASWNDLISCTQDTDIETLSLELVKFVCRLGLILYPSHLNALKTLHQLRSPLAVIRDLEWFVVSDMLGKVRKRHAITARVAISDGLKNKVQ